MRRTTPDSEWIAKIFGSVAAWKKSLPRGSVAFGRKRKPVIHIRLIKSEPITWKLPCPDKPLPPEVVHSVRNAVVGVGPRPRLRYEMQGQSRLAVGRRGESADRLRDELVALYGLRPFREVKPSNGLLASYVAEEGSYRPYARPMRLRNADFLARAADPAEVEQSALLSDRHFERVWRVVPTYVVEDRQASNDGNDPPEKMTEVVIGDPGGKNDPRPQLPMAVTKSDGRGSRSLYFGHELDRGGGRRWCQEDFEPPLHIALGGELNRLLGFGASSKVDEYIPYCGDGYHWDRNNPLAKRTTFGRGIGPVCRILEHPQPHGDWYDWLGIPYPLPVRQSWEAWGRRKAHYERMRLGRGGNVRLGAKA